MKSLLPFPFLTTYIDKNSQAFIDAGWMKFKVLSYQLNLRSKLLIAHWFFLFYWRYFHTLHAIWVKCGDLGYERWTWAASHTLLAWMYPPSWPKPQPPLRCYLFLLFLVGWSKPSSYSYTPLPCSDSLWFSQIPFFFYRILWNHLKFIQICWQFSHESLPLKGIFLWNSLQDFQEFPLEFL